MPKSDPFGVDGRKVLDELHLDPACQARVLSLRRPVEVFDFEIDVIAKRVAAELANHRGCRDTPNASATSATGLHLQDGPVTMLHHAQLHQHSAECHASTEPAVSRVKRT